MTGAHEQRSILVADDDWVVSTLKDRDESRLSRENGFYDEKGVSKVASLNSKIPRPTPIF